VFQSSVAPTTLPFLLPHWEADMQAAGLVAGGVLFPSCTVEVERAVCIRDVISVADPDADALSLISGTCSQ
jgi:hypothetical protein